MERTRDFASALAATAGGVATALGFVTLYLALSVPVMEVLQRMV